MKVSLNWLKDYVDLPPDLTPEKLSYDLTMTTVEVEEFECLDSRFEKMCIGKVTEIKPHPNADRLKIVMTDIGSEIKEVVCGGINLEVGMLVAIAAPGAMVRWHGEGDYIELGEAKIRGVKSFGMICASSEIGLAELFPADDERIILDLSEFDCKAGTPLAEALELSDVIFDIDNKSLTNRPDLWGHYGIARELAAIYSVPLKPLDDFNFPKGGSGLEVAIHNPELSSRYTGVVIEGTKYQKSPFWMQTRLASVGQRPIHLLVDLTNYVLFALGQPTHVFDINQVKGAEIHIRCAKKGETLELLDGTITELEPWMLVIADKERPVALAGVMGGANSGIEEETETFVLEIANFKGTQIRRTAAKLGVRSESSMRYEKNLDPARVELGAKLFLSLLAKEQPKTSVSCFVDCFPAKPEQTQVVVEQEFITSRTGMKLSDTEIVSLLMRLGFEVECEGTKLIVGVPSWRATGDVSLPEDIVEEVARLYGYDNLEFVAPPVILEKAVKQPALQLERKIREYLAFSCGMHEVFSYPWIEEQYQIAAGVDLEKLLKICDPPSPTLETLHSTLVPSMFSAMAKNIKNFSSFSVFEINRVYRPGKMLPWSTAEELLPEQPKMLAGAVVDANLKDVFLKTKGMLSSLFEALPMESPCFKLEGNFSSWCTRGASLAICLNKKQIGELAVVSKQALSKAGLGDISAAVFELKVDQLKPLSATFYDFTPLPKYPSILYDLALLFDSDVTWEKIESTVKGSDPLIQSVSFSDEYTGTQIEEGKKSVAFQLTIGDSEKTLTSDQAQQVVNKLLKRFKSKLGGVLRDR